MSNPLELSELLSALAEAGFTFIRIKTLDKRPEGKWSKERITPAQVLSRIKEGRNYGIVPPADCFILDFDSDEAYQRSISLEPVIAISLTFKTPRGYHVLFEGEGIPQGASHTCLGQGVDVRTGSKGYVVGPGSKRKDGHYEYLHGDSIEPVPDSLRKLLQKPESRPTSEVFPDGLPQSGKPAESPVASPGELSEGRRALTVMEAGRAAKKHWKALEKAEEGERNDTIARAACGLGSLYANADEDKRTEVFGRLMEHADRLGDGDYAEIQQNRTTATNQWNKGTESPADRPDNTQESTRYRIVFPQFDSQEFEQALANLNISVRNNQERDKIEFTIADDGSWPIPTGFRFVVDKWFTPDEKTSDSIIYYLNRYFGRQKGEAEIGVSITDKKFWQWVYGIASQNPYRPFRDWIEKCQLNPDLAGLTLENWLDPWLENRESDLNRWTAKAIFIGIVQKVYGEEQACRTIPVLRGEKGIGKTTLVSELIPEEYRLYFGQFQVKRRAEMVGSLIGKFLCEFGELDGMTSSKVSTFKEFIGNPINTSRLPYERNHLDYLNTAFIIGTSNPERNVPNDDALLSRLVFMNVQKAHDPKIYLPDRLPHLYALARDAYKAGAVVGVLPEHLEAEQKEADEESVIVNQIMDDKIRAIDWRQLGEWFTLYDVMRVAGLLQRGNVKGPVGAEKAVRDYLKELGVGVKRKDMKKKGPAKSNRQWHYHESEVIQKIRTKQTNLWGAMKPQYGEGAETKIVDFSEL